MAEIQWRAVVDSTDGPVEHAKTLCVRGHWFLLPPVVLSNPPFTQRQAPEMTGHDVVDLGRALDLLAAAADEGSGRLVVRALSLAGAGQDDLAALGTSRIRELYARDALPVPLTLGALVVLDAAQRSQDCGDASNHALDHARQVATRFLDLLPDPAFPSPRHAPQPARHCVEAAALQHSRPRCVLQTSEEGTA